MSNNKIFIFYDIMISVVDPGRELGEVINKAIFPIVVGRLIGYIFLPFTRVLDPVLDIF